MADYTFSGTTQQLGTAHSNKVAAIRIDPGGSPIFTVLDETTADGSGNFTLNWGDTYATEAWAGRIVVIAVDDDNTDKLDSVARDWQTGTLV